MDRFWLFWMMTLLFVSQGMACSSSSSTPGSPGVGTHTLQQNHSCTNIPEKWGPVGKVPLRAEKWISHLSVPWGLAFLPNGSALVTERPGRVRLIRNGVLVAQPVVEVSVGESVEGGLLGIAVHPQFSKNRSFYVYYTANVEGRVVNRLQRFQLSQDESSAQAGSILIDEVSASPLHDGGRLKFGPDGMLYLGTGDARNPELAQDLQSLNGKILRIDPNGSIPPDNPYSGSRVYVLGVRNPEAFDWVDTNTMIVADHGPSGELGLTGMDEVSYAGRGSNLGWPKISGCQTYEGMVTPLLTWTTASPPGGGTLCRKCNIEEFDGSFLIGMLGIGDSAAHQLHRIAFDEVTGGLKLHESYFQGQFGRLREVVQGPDGSIYVLTSNCDSRGNCPEEGDSILRIVKG